jgi:hypothetical protein
MDIFRQTPFRCFAVLAVFAAVSAAGAEVVLPDPASGVIDGTIALLLWPTTADARHTPLPAEGCNAHVAPADALTRELIFPCKNWFQPPGPGRYLVWLEQGTFVSVQTFVLFDYVKFHGLGHTILMPMKPAGWLRVSAHAGHAEDTVRVLSLEPASKEPRAFDRTLPASREDARLRVPAGPAIAGVFDSAGRALALSHPVKVPRGGEVTAAPQAPQSGSDVLLSLVRRKHAAGEPCRATLTLDDGSQRAADAMLESWDRVVAVWYAANGEGGRIAVDCAPSNYEKAVKLPPKSVLTIRDELP